ncbi:MAG TPA: 3-oxoacyl-[acyl-carrier-protein] synthase III C-terminal domain-containing protein [Kofleriaceae bacterium]|jgi:predicted naringenin-chalcone synthase
MPAITISRFASARPRHELDQARALAWLADAHAKLEAARDPRVDLADRVRHFARLLQRVGCGPDRIARRGHSLGDRADALVELAGQGSEARTRRFAELADAYFRDAYSAEREAPDDLIHVTCTGYASPSAAQKLVASRRGWTRVTHAYHMGCYAAVPALHIASGFVANGSRRVDIAHTELCSLHFDPASTALDQLVVQSLFGDGLIHYAVVPGDRGGLVVRALHEQLLADSADSMTWITGDHGNRMTLARDVPGRIASAVRGFVIALLARGGFGVAALKQAVVAVHPGGPKIVDSVQTTLELDDSQVAHSRGVLRDFGNMSSATLPHIWMRVLDDERVAPATLVASLAFGPGLTISGALFEKRP